MLILTLQVCPSASKAPLSLLYGVKVSLICASEEDNGKQPRKKQEALTRAGLEDVGVGFYCHEDKTVMSNIIVNTHALTHTLNQTHISVGVMIM